MGFWSRIFKKKYLDITEDEFIRIINTNEMDCRRKMMDEVDNYNNRMTIDPITKVEVYWSDDQSLVVEKWIHRSRKIEYKKLNR